MRATGNAPGNFEPQSAIRHFPTTSHPSKLGHKLVAGIRVLVSSPDAPKDSPCRGADLSWLKTLTLMGKIGECGADSVVVLVT
ncbi:hypothetical protein TNCV_3322881 [Trichonephila clavipes]|nr:hypothetical protein TNCV_3322881 [Trichonephila clavipes]